MITHKKQNYKECLSQDFAARRRQVVITEFAKYPAAVKRLFFTFAQPLFKESTVHSLETCHVCRPSLQPFSKVGVCSDPTAGVVLRI